MVLDTLEVQFKHFVLRALVGLTECLINMLLAGQSTRLQAAT